MEKQIIKNIRELLDLKEQKKYLFIQLKELFKQHIILIQEERLEDIELLMIEEKQYIMSIDAIDIKYNDIEKQFSSYTSQKEIENLYVIEFEKLQGLQQEIEDIASHCKKLNGDIREITKNIMDATRIEIQGIQFQKQKIKQQENATHKYLNPYEQASQYSYFIDKNK